MVDFGNLARSLAGARQPGQVDSFGDRERLMRRRMLAEAMMGQRHTSPVAAGIQGLVSALNFRNADKRLQDISTQQKETDARAFSQLAQALQGGDTVGAQTAAAQIEDERLSRLAQEMLGQANQAASAQAQRSFTAEQNELNREAQVEAAGARREATAEQNRLNREASAEQNQARIDAADRRARSERESELRLTPAEKKVDETFAKDYNEFIAQGGFADVEKNISQLRDVQRFLKNTDTASGGVVGFVPKFIRDAIPGLSEGANAQDLVEEVVQRNLRLILGAQFTEKEGERLIARAYNPRQDESVNAARLDRLVNQIEGAASAKLAAAEYFEQNGTLKGFEGASQFSIEDFIAGADEEEGMPESMQLPMIEDDQGNVMVLDPRTNQWVPLDGQLTANP